nr:PaaI family thioesterase [Bacteroidota bacterium]
MRKVNNPFRGTPGYNCFGCSPDNPNGLHLHFIDEGEYLTAAWEPNPVFQGYHGVLHGGIQATLMDEIASWYVYAKLETAGVTSKMNVRYKQPVYVNKGSLLLKAKLHERRRNLVDIDVVLLDSDQKICATAMVQYFTFPEKVARERMYYPGPESFFSE